MSWAEIGLTNENFQLRERIRLLEEALSADMKALDLAMRCFKGIEGDARRVTPTNYAHPLGSIKGLANGQAALISIRIEELRTLLTTVLEQK
jgi:hypothetical protein